MLSMLSLQKLHLQPSDLINVKLKKKKKGSTFIFEHQAQGSQNFRKC